MFSGPYIKSPLSPFRSTGHSLMLRLTIHGRLENWHCLRQTCGCEQLLNFPAMENCLVGSHGMAVQPVYADANPYALKVTYRFGMSKQKDNKPQKPFPEVEDMEFGPGEETCAGTKGTRILQFWVLWVSTPLKESPTFVLFFFLLLFKDDSKQKRLSLISI
uniref:Uncharacterized protein n=1 Tax=Cucumis sativus TaxID=3659 RepID=A0A0A0KCA1_CUCSA